MVHDSIAKTREKEYDKIRERLFTTQSLIYLIKEPDEMDVHAQIHDRLCCVHSKNSVS